MSNAPVIINEIKINFEIVKNQVFINSLDLAKVFNKRHDNIIQTIENLPQDEFNALNFNAVSYKASNGKTNPCYNLTRDGFSLLVMGFTGEKAYKWKIEFIKAFNEMEKRLKNLELESISSEIKLLKQELKAKEFTNQKLLKHSEETYFSTLNKERQLDEFYRKRLDEIDLFLNSFLNDALISAFNEFRNDMIKHVLKNLKGIYNHNLELKKKYLN